MGRSTRTFCNNSRPALQLLFPTKKSHPPSTRCSWVNLHALLTASGTSSTQWTRSPHKGRCGKPLSCGQRVRRSFVQHNLPRRCPAPPTTLEMEVYQLRASYTHRPRTIKVCTIDCSSSQQSMLRQFFLQREVCTTIAGYMYGFALWPFLLTDFQRPIAPQPRRYTYED